MRSWISVTEFGFSLEKSSQKHSLLACNFGYGRDKKYSVQHSVLNRQTEWLTSNFWIWVFISDDCGNYFPFITFDCSWSLLFVSPLVKLCVFFFYSSKLILPVCNRTSITRPWTIRFNIFLARHRASHLEDSGEYYYFCVFSWPNHDTLRYFGFAREFTRVIVSFHAADDNENVRLHSGMRWMR